jgi:hypothetical protein
VGRSTRGRAAPPFSGWPRPALGLAVILILRLEEGRITDTEPEQVVSLLNDYSDMIVSTIQEYGGDVLKLIGDGTLAIFTAETRTHACSALAAAVAAPPSSEAHATRTLRFVTMSLRRSNSERGDHALGVHEICAGAFRSNATATDPRTFY